MKFTPTISPTTHSELHPSTVGMTAFSIAQAKEIMTEHSDAAIELCLLIEDKYGTQMTLTDVVTIHQEQNRLHALMVSLDLEEEYQKGEINPECLVHRGGFVQLSVTPTETQPRIQILRYFPAADCS